jgi:hypothetical protein
MSAILDFISKNGGFVGAVVLVAGALNVVLSGAKQLIMMFEAPAAQAGDAKLSWISKIMGVLSKVLDYLSANVAH